MMNRNIKNLIHLLKTEEIILWFIIGMIFFIEPIVFAVNERVSFFDIIVINTYSATLIIGLTFILFPFIFYRIFGKYPLESIRKNKPNIIKA